jgi:hypothetical protein
MGMTAKHANATLETHAHINEVRSNISLVVKDLIDRANVHDKSKLESPEVEIFGDHTHKLGEVEYGSDEYNELLAEVQPAIDHHYSKNRHHPEHWPNSLNDMTLVDLLEMLCDWKAATGRNKNGNIRKSIEVNAERYKISPQLRKIFENTVRELFPE